MTNIIYSVTDLLNFGVIIFAFFISIVHRKKNLLPIHIYITALMFIMLPIEAVNYLIPQNKFLEQIKTITLNVFSIVEIFLLYYFINQNLSRKFFKIVTLLLFMAYVLICCTIWFGKRHAFSLFMPDLFGIENLFITISCLFYFYEVFKSDLNIDFKSDPTFIIMSGILFYFSVTTPLIFSFYVLSIYALDSLNIFLSLNLLFNTILIFSFGKAFLCPIPIQK